MSTGAQVAVIPPVGQHGERAEARPTPSERPLVRLVAVAALAAYGIVRWSTLLSPAPGWRLVGLLAMCLALTAIGVSRPVLGRWLVAVAAVVAVVAMFALSGVPLRWLVHVRIAVTVNWIEGGLSALPGVYLPYSGINESVRVVMLLGAGLLLLDAGLLLAFVPRGPGGLGDLRRAAAALPLTALAVIPSTLLHPQLPYLQGLILFALLALMMWGERVRRDDLAAVLGLAAAVGVGGIILAPRLDQHQPWIDPHSLANGFAPSRVDTFNWSQRYGPLNWPRTGHEVLDVKASKAADYWKAQDLDTFDGRGWAAGNSFPRRSLPGPDAASLRRWTQTLDVTIRAMRTSDVIAAGYAFSPQHISGAIPSAAGAGTWLSASQLGPGASYSVRVYTPHPTPHQLATAWDGNPGGAGLPGSALRGYLTLTMPQAAASTAPAQRVSFAPFGSQGAPRDLTDPGSIDGLSAVERSAYDPAYKLARRLAQGAPTPYAYVRRVMQYLARGFEYNESPPPSAHPLETFLLTSKLGYCQQFAGGMALLLRLGGVPARVATGFTPGTYNTTTHEWVVSDIDAHAWVEAWFPSYGWVRFDPTPSAAPALGGHTAIASVGGVNKVVAAPIAPRKTIGAVPTTPVPVRVRGGGGGSSAWLIGLLAVLGAATVALLAVTRGVADPSGEQLLSELERAMSRSGRPISSGVTLMELEHRFRISADAAAYVRAIRTMRFAETGTGMVPTRRQRRAVRAHLRAGLGLGGRLRALWALPPQWVAPRWLSSRRVRRPAD